MLPSLTAFWHSLRSIQRTASTSDSCRCSFSASTGLIAGLIAHKIGKINEQTDQKQIFKWALLAAIGGLLFNVIFDPLIGYFYKLVLLGKPAAEVTLSWNVAATSINAVLSTIASVVIYMALRPALQKSGLFSQVKAAAK